MSGSNHAFTEHITVCEETLWFTNSREGAWVVIMRGFPAYLGSPGVFPRLWFEQYLQEVKKVQGE